MGNRGSFILATAWLSSRHSARARSDSSPLTFCWLPLSWTSTCACKHTHTLSPPHCLHSAQQLQVSLECLCKQASLHLSLPKVPCCNHMSMLQMHLTRRSAHGSDTKMEQPIQWMNADVAIGQQRGSGYRVSAMQRLTSEVQPSKLHGACTLLEVSAMMLCSACLSCCCCCSTCLSSLLLCCCKLVALSRHQFHYTHAWFNLDASMRIMS